jgi:predicted GIY-YIG superfamily endonuclease
MEKEYTWKIYRIFSKRDANTVYVGSTKESLHNRLGKHKADIRGPKTNAVKSAWMLENYDDLEIMEIDSANTKEEALRREKAEISKHIEQGYRVLNMQLPRDLELPKDRCITYEQQYRKCGKPACKKCLNGQGHGPYWYAFWSEDKKLKSAYIGKERKKIV